MLPTNYHRFELELLDEISLRLRCIAQPSVRLSQLRMHPRELRLRDAQLGADLLRLAPRGDQLARESEALLDDLWSYAVPADYVVEQNWTPGDVIIWDNRRCLHKRTSIHPSQRRLLLRCQVLARVS